MGEFKDYLLALIAAILTVVIYRGQRKIAIGQFHQAHQNLWNVYNTEAIKKDNIKMAQWLNSYDKKNILPADKQIAVNLAFMFINALQAGFVGKKLNLLNADYADNGLRQLLPPLLLKKDIYELTQYRGYFPEFAEGCRLYKEYIEENYIDKATNEIIKDEKGNPLLSRENPPKNLVGFYIEKTIFRRVQEWIQNSSSKPIYLSLK